MSATKDGRDEEEQGFLESPYREEGHKESAEGKALPRSPRRSLIFYLRVLLELAMAGTIAVLLARPFSSPVKRSPVPQRMAPLPHTKALTCWLSGWHGL
jgi:hypothetical protein